MPSSHEMFMAQLNDFISQYGLWWLSGTVLCSFILAFTVHYFVNILPLKRARARDLADEKDAALDAEISKGQNGKNDDPNIKLVGKMMNTSGFRRQYVHFDDEPNADSIKSASISKVSGNEQEKKRKNAAEDDESEGSSSEAELLDEEEEEEEMPPMDRRYVKRKILPVPAPSMDCPDENLKANEMHERDIVSQLGELHGKLATARIRSQARKLEQQMSEQEREEEAAIRQKQLEQIMALMMENKDKFGIPSEDDVKDQLRMYSF